jgi:hypothetical protein
MTHSFSQSFSQGAGGFSNSSSASFSGMP